MTYYAVSQLSRDSHITDRITACAVIEGETSPDNWAYENRWKLAATPGWREAYGAALTARQEDPGMAPDVISDDMIRDAVRALREAANTAEPKQ